MKYFIGTIRATFNISNICKLANPENRQNFIFSEILEYVTLDDDQKHNLNPQNNECRHCDKVDIF